MATTKKALQVSDAMITRLEIQLHTALMNLQASESELDNIRKRLHESVMNQDRSPDEVLANIERHEAALLKWFSSRAAAYVARSTMQGLGIVKDQA